MDFYDSLLQYDLEVQNKLTERINIFIKSISLLKKESLINHPNVKDPKYKHINILLDEINTSNKFKNTLLLNHKKNLLIRMNNKNKINSKYYIYAKDMNQDNQKMDIIEIENTKHKWDSNVESKSTKIKPYLELEKGFNQKKINYDIINENKNISDEEKNFNKFKSDINKIVCDIIRQNVKNIYNKKINEILLNKIEINKDKNTIEKVLENRTINNNIKNNNYIKIELPKKEFYFREIKEGKENKKIHNNHSTDKNTNYINYFKDNKKKSIKKELRNSVANNNANHLKIKVYKNDILNFNNLNNNNINNLLIINNKIKSAKNDNHNNNNKSGINNNNNVQSKNIENENKINQKETIKPETEDIMNGNDKNMNIKNNNKTNNEKINNKLNNKNADQSHKKMIIRNIQRIQIKNIKLKNNPTGYNLTNICKKKFADFENPERNDLKKSRPKNRNCASPGDIGLNNKKINILKFKLGKNEPVPNRKNTEKSFKKKKDVENNNDNDNSIISIIDDKTKDIYSHPIRFSSVKKKKISDDMSNNDLSQVCQSKKVNKNNFLIRNYKTNINRNNNNNNNYVASNKNSFTKESENDNFFIINKNNQMKKSLSKESDSHSYLPWNFENTNSITNKSNNKGNLVDSYLNHIIQIDKKNNIDNNLKNINEYKKVNNNNNINYIYNEDILQNNELKNYYPGEQKFGEQQIKNQRIKNTINNKNFKENKNLVKAGYNDTITNRGEPISYREDDKIKGKKRILSTRVHIRGVNSSKNFNNIF